MAHGALRIADLPDDEILLERYAEELDNGRYLLDDIGGDRSSVLGAIKIALALGRPPTMIMRTDAIIALIQRVEALEARVGF